MKNYHTNHDIINLHGDFIGLLKLVTGKTYFILKLVYDLSILFLSLNTLLYVRALHVNLFNFNA